MKFLKRLLWIQIIIFCFTLSILSQTEKSKKFDVESMADDELISYLGSDKNREATQSAIEIFKRGERMIPLLMKLKGNKSNYNGFCLGDPKGADHVFEIEIVEGSTVTVEVAALYLITAIHYNNLAFANVPYLTENKRITNFQYNALKRVKKAWKATEQWYEKLKKDGLEKLRKDNEFPLKSTKIHFLGTNPQRKRDISDCEP
jgi:hypothetical protein